MKEGISESTQCPQESKDKGGCNRWLALLMTSTDTFLENLDFIPQTDGEPGRLQFTSQKDHLAVTQRIICSCDALKRILTSLVISKSIHQYPFGSMPMVLPRFVGQKMQTLRTIIESLERGPRLVQSSLKYVLKNSSSVSSIYHESM